MGLERFLRDQREKEDRIQGREEGKPKPKPKPKPKKKGEKEK